MDIGSWLLGLGLAQYEPTFRDNQIEADVLADLTESDLEKIGLQLGPRKRILKAIANLDPAALLTATPAAPPARRGCRRTAAIDRDVHRPGGLYSAGCPARS